MEIEVGQWDSDLFLVDNKLIWKEEQFKGWLGKAPFWMRHAVGG